MKSRASALFRETKMLIFEKMCVLLLLMISGYFANRSGILTEEASQKISSLVVNIASPAMIISSSAGSLNLIEKKDAFFAMAVSWGIFAVLLVMAEVLCRLPWLQQRYRGIYCCMLVFSNIGFMGLPIMKAVYGDMAVLYGAMFQIPFNVLIYTYGVMRIRGASVGEDGSASEMGRSGSGGGWKIRKILNNGVCAVLVLLFLFFTSFTLPGVIMETLGYFTNLCVPCSMMVIGASMGGIRPGDILQDKPLLVFSLLKQIVIPLGMMAVIRHLVSDADMLGAILVVLATPIASMVVMMAKEYHGESKLAAEAVTLTTLLSVVTIPLISALTGI